MVRQKYLLMGVATLSLLIPCSLPARAYNDSILEKMQNEIANIAEKVRNAVVTIEDEHALTVTGNAFILSSPFSSIPEEIISLETEEKQSQILLQSLQEERKRVEGQYKAGLAPIANLNDIDTKIKQVEIQRQGLTKRLALKRSSLSRWNQLTYRKDIVNAPDPNKRETINTEVTRVELRLDELKQKYTETSPKVVQLKSYLESLKKRADDQKKQEGEWTALQFLEGTRNRADVFVVSPQTGSGFSIGEDYIVTTSDVLNGMQNPVVVTDNGTRITAKIVGNNRDLNVGLLRLNVKANIGSLKLGDSSAVRSGHFAVSIGNQAGQPNSVTLMLVGNIRNEGTYAGNQFYPSLIQIAGSIGAGTSGAPLVNVHGEVIGMMAAIPVDMGYARLQPFGSYYSPTTTPEERAAAALIPQKSDKGEVDPAPQVLNLPEQRQFFFSAPQQNVSNASFAIPINRVKSVVDELRSEKPIVRGWIGIAPEDVVTTIEKKGIIEIARTVRITGVYPDSPAFVAGVQPGDVVTLLNDKPVRNAGDVRELSLRLKKGDAVRLTVKRPKETRNLTLTISARPTTIKPPITAPLKESF